jgi:hypothetical protein
VTFMKDHDSDYGYLKLLQISTLMASPENEQIPLH